MRHSQRKNQNTAEQTFLGENPGVPEISKGMVIIYLGMSAFSTGLDCSAGQRGAWPHNWKMGWKWGGGMGYDSLCAPKICQCQMWCQCWADHRALDHSPVLGPWLGFPVFPCSPYWHRYHSVPYTPRILPHFFFFFLSNCLKLISSSSAHHSSLYDDSNQVVGGFAMAVSDILIKAVSFCRRKCYDLIMVF